MHQIHQALEEILATLAGAPRLQSGTTAQARLREHQVLARLSRQYGVVEEELRMRLRDLRRRAKLGYTEGESGADKAAVESLASWERELLEIVLLEPEAVPAAAEVAPPDEMESPIASRIFTRCCELSRDGITPDFDRLLLEFDEPAIKNLLVDLDEHGRAKTIGRKGQREADGGASGAVARFARYAQASRDIKAAVDEHARQLRDTQLTSDEELAVLERLIEQGTNAARHFLAHGWVRAWPGRRDDSRKCVAAPADEVVDLARPWKGAKEVAVHHGDKDLHELIAQGKKQGYLTYDEVNAYLPDEAVNPEKLDNLLMALDEAGIELLTDPPQGAASGKKPEAESAEVETLTLPPDELRKLNSDPVRMYLSQMAVIPLLTREQEISLAKKIEVTRKRFRRSVLGCNFAMQVTIDTLQKVHQGTLPFDRTIKVSLTERLTKEQILARMPHNLGTLQLIRQHNRDDFRKLIRLSTPRQEKLDARGRFCRRRRKALQLVEELSLRTRRVQPLVKQLREFSRRMDFLRRRLTELKSSPAAMGERDQLRRELRDLMMLTLESPRSLRNRLGSGDAAIRRLRARQAPAFQRQLAAGGQHRQEVSQSRAQLPGPDSGREHRPDARGR